METLPGTHDPFSTDPRQSALAFVEAGAGHGRPNHQRIDRPRKQRHQKHKGHVHPGAAHQLLTALNSKVMALPRSRSDR